VGKESPVIAQVKDKCPVKIAKSDPWRAVRLDIRERGKVRCPHAVFLGDISERKHGWCLGQCGARRECGGQGKNYRCMATSLMKLMVN
jgi:hypothetical protein